MTDHGFTDPSIADGIPVRMEVGGVHRVVSFTLPPFVQGVEAGATLRMERDSGDYWKKLYTGETDARFGDRVCIDIGFTKDAPDPNRWFELRRRCGKDMGEGSHGSTNTHLGVMYFCMRRGYERGADGPGFLVPEWLEYDVYVPRSVQNYSLCLTYVGASDLFLQQRRADVDRIVNTMKDIT